MASCSARSVSRCNPARPAASTASAASGCGPSTANAARQSTALLPGRCACSQATDSSSLGARDRRRVQRLCTVTGKRQGSPVTSSSSASPGGSSKVLSKAFAALRLSRSAGARIATLRPPPCAVSASSAASSRTWSMRISLESSMGRSVSRSGCSPATTRRQSRHAPQGAAGLRQNMRAAIHVASHSPPCPGAACTSSA